MDLSDSTVLVAMHDPAWLVGARLKHAGVHVVMADSLAVARQLLHGDETHVDALLVGVRLPDGYAGSLIREARSGPRPCAALVCVTDLASEAFLVAPALLEGPWDIIALPQEAARLIAAVHGTVQRTKLLRRWASAGIGECGACLAEPDAPVPRDAIEDRIVEAARALAAPEKLSHEELEVLRELAAGYRPAEIARRTGKSVATVRSQLKAVRSKLGKDSLVTLVTSVFAHALAKLDTGPLPSSQPSPLPPIHQKG